MLVASLTTGAIGLPVGVPRPVVKSTTLAPAPTCAVVASTSLPGVQSRLSPGVRGVLGIVEHVGHRRELPPFRAAPADFIASVINPSLMLPGEGFMSKPEPTACARAL